MKKIKNLFTSVWLKIKSTKAFSMIELVISMFIISLILAALTPMITKKAHQMVKS